MEREKLRKKISKNLVSYELPHMTKTINEIMTYIDDYFNEQLALCGVTTRFSPAIEEMKEAIITSLKELEKGYGKRKSAIEKDTEIPIDILTVLLKQLKNEGKIELIMIWSESTSMPNGSGYCLTGNLIY